MNFEYIDLYCVDCDNITKQKFLFDFKDGLRQLKKIFML